MPNNKSQRGTGRRPSRGRANKNSVGRQMLQAQINTMDRPNPSVRDALEMKLKRNKTHTISQTYESGVDLTSAFWSLNFQLANLPQASSFAGVFDNFRVVQLKMEFYGPNFTVTAIDLNDGRLPTTFDQLLNYETTQVVNGIPFWQRIFAPKYIVDGFADVSAPATLSAGWIPCLDDDGVTLNDTPWGNLKIAFGGTRTLETTVIVTAIVSFKNLE